MKKMIILTGLISFAMFYLYQKSNESYLVGETVSTDHIKADQPLNISTTSVEQPEAENRIQNPSENLAPHLNSDLELKTQMALDSGYISEDEVQEFKLNQLQYLRASAELEEEAASELFDDSQT